VDLHSAQDAVWNTSQACVSANAQFKSYNLRKVAASCVTMARSQWHQLKILNGTKRQSEVTGSAWTIGAGDDYVGSATLQNERAHIRYSSNTAPRTGEENRHGRFKAQT